MEGVSACMRVHFTSAHDNNYDCEDLLAEELEMAIMRSYIRGTRDNKHEDLAHYRGHASAWLALQGSASVFQQQVAFEL
ncbi:hypothetical protein NDU88_002901 [Pleurodeles waltl]|uniref:Uncharacterized protein n=1 Tax=Pleurodeles waltl TaxID=8319 RepID=A0AAV7UB71_PLEWA|nr:hypothetical protein NDU88_002901 [Pleurodeles waltl]